MTQGFKKIPEGYVTQINLMEILMQNVSYFSQCSKCSHKNSRQEKSSTTYLGRYHSVAEGQAHTHSYAYKTVFQHSVLQSPGPGCKITIALLGTTLPSRNIMPIKTGCGRLGGHNLFSGKATLGHNVFRKFSFFPVTFHIIRGRRTIQGFEPGKLT